MIRIKEEELGARSMISSETGRKLFRFPDAQCRHQLRRQMRAEIAVRRWLVAGPACRRRSLP
jgi:hypothetical protein